MPHSTLVLLMLTALPTVVSAQTDTTRRRDTTRTAQPQDSARRVRAESRGETDLTRATARFREDLPNYGLSGDQAIELQQALTRAGCDVGTADGIVGQRTLQGIECFRTQQSLGSADLESVLTALKVSYARPVPAPVSPPTPPPRRDTAVKLPEVIRPDSNYRPDVRARRDSALRRDSVRRDSLRRDSTARRDTTMRRDTTRRRDGRG
jgi:peptidoglycan hydrolase-like protein with peptidoglycan-binding domain